MCSVYSTAVTNIFGTLVTCLNRQRRATAPFHARVHELHVSAHPRSPCGRLRMTLTTVDPEMSNTQSKCLVGPLPICRFYTPADLSAESSIVVASTSIDDVCAQPSVQLGGTHTHDGEAHQAHTLRTGVDAPLPRHLTSTSSVAVYHYLAKKMRKETMCVRFADARTFRDAPDHRFYSMYTYSYLKPNAICASS